MALKKFAHGGDVQNFAKELQCDAKEIIDLSSNINFIKPTLPIDFNSLNISDYPNYDKLYSLIANNYNLQSEQIELFNGGSSGIFSLFHFLHLQSCTIYSPAYLEYKKAAIQFGYKLHMINRLENIEELPTPHSLIIFVNPSTPDGTFYDIEKLMVTWDKLQCSVLIDESFIEFTDEQSAIKYLDKYPNLYILKSMTKFYSSAGIRIGAIISNQENIKNLKMIEPAWKISQFDSTYIQEVLKDTEFKEKSKKQNAINKKMLFSILLNCSLFESVYPSSANYILVKLKNITADEFQERLKRYKIMIRDCSNFDFLDESYIRIAVKSTKELTAFQKSLNQIQKYYQE
jgi:threonine-phosphate decarboxylase